MTPQSEVDAWMKGYLAGYHDGARGNAYRGREPIGEFTYEPARDHWTPYEPWMRDVLADDARVSLLDEGEQRSTWASWASYGFTVDGWMAGRDARIHPDDVPVEGGYKRRAERERRYREEAEADLADMTRQRDKCATQAEKAEADAEHWRAEFNQADQRIVGLTAERDEWQERHAALREDVDRHFARIGTVELGDWVSLTAAKVRLWRILTRDSERGGQA